MHTGGAGARREAAGVAAKGRSLGAGTTPSGAPPRAHLAGGGAAVSVAKQVLHAAPVVADVLHAQLLRQLRRRLLLLLLLLLVVVMLGMRAVVRRQGRGGAVARRGLV